MSAIVCGRRKRSSLCHICRRRLRDCSRSSPGYVNTHSFQQMKSHQSSLLLFSMNHWASWNLSFTLGCLMKGQKYSRLKIENRSVTTLSKYFSDKLTCRVLKSSSSSSLLCAVLLNTRPRGVASVLSNDWKLEGSFEKRPSREHCLLCWIEHRFERCGRDQD